MMVIAGQRLTRAASPLVRRAGAIAPSAARPAYWLVLAAVGYALAQLAAVGPSIGPGWDETVYLSQFHPTVPTEYFSAPRARGITLVPLPVLAFTGSVVAMRLYMTAVSAAGLVAAYWPWLTLIGGRLTGLAALLLTGLWVVGFYGNQVMPNLYVAYAALAATGWFLHAYSVTDRRRPTVPQGRALGAVAVSVAVMALFRPPDTAFLVAALAAAALVVPAWRRWRVLAALTGGAAAGMAPWLAEAYVRFGGPLHRLALADRTEGGLGWHPDAIWMQLRALNGPMLCRPCTTEWRHPELSLWWLALPILVTAGVVCMATTRRPAPLNGAPLNHRLPYTWPRIAALPAGCGMVLAIPYVLLTPYAAPRFLTATYALWTIPIAFLIARPFTAQTGPRPTVTSPQRLWGRRAVQVATAALLVTHLASQQLILAHRSADQRRARDQIQALVAHLHRIGLRPPCALAGDQASFIGYYSQCTSAATAGDNPAATRRTLAETARTVRATAVLAQRARPPAGVHGWTRTVFTPPTGRRWYIYRPPGS